MARWRYVIEDMTTRATGELGTMKAARERAKEWSTKSGHVVAIVALDTNDRSRHPQGAYYGRSWRGGAHHYR